MARRRRVSSFRKIFDIVLTITGFVAVAWFVAWLETRNPTVMSGNAIVLDGDSLIVDGEKIRLQGIDAPEFNQTCRRDGKDWQCGRQSRDALRKLVRGQNVSCKASSLDIYDRWLAACTVGDQNINLTLVENGWAVDYGGYATAERRARNESKGIWTSSFERPRDWRRTHKGDALSDGGVLNPFKLVWARLKSMFRRYLN